MSAKPRDRKRPKKMRSASAPRFVAVAAGNVANMILTSLTSGTVLLGYFAAKKFI